MSNSLATLTIAETIRIAREVRAATLLSEQEARRLVSLVTMSEIASMALLVCFLDLIAQRAAEHLIAPAEGDPLDDLRDALLHAGYLQLQPEKEPAHGEG